ncbi:MAG: hypothetical protein ACOCY8_07155, partial [Spirochaetota bacterium]
MKRVLFVMLLFAAMLATLFVSCQRSDEEEEPALEIDPDATLVIWADEQRAPILEELGGQFTETYGVPVTVQQLGFGDIRDNL